MPQQFKLKQRYFDKDNVAGVVARNVQELLDQMPVMEQKTIEQFYAEPLVIGGLREEPFCIECVRVVNLFAPQKPVACGGMCHFYWLPQLSGAQINSIDGMSPVTDGATRFRFYFRITYKL